MQETLSIHLLSDSIGEIAEQMEMVLDAYERTTSARQLVMFTNLFHGFLADHGRTWERNEYNDDIMWMVIACTRAHLLTGNPEFRDVTRTNFDLCYARAASTNLGGGLWWRTDNRSKNACVNGPGAIAAFLLGRATGDGAYFTKATNLFLWERATLYDSATGRVFDNINTNGRVGRFALTYNQGTFVGAANLLGFTNEARLAATFTAEPLEDTLRHLTTKIGLDAKVQFARYNQVFQELLNPHSLVGSATSGMAALLLRIEDWFRYSAEAPSPQAVDTMLDDFVAALRGAGERSRVPLLLTLVPHSPKTVRKLHLAERRRACA